MDPAELPIRKFAPDIVKAIKANTVIVVIGETGSGKTTQISQILLENGYGEIGLIGVTQPRRVGAVTVARRVAEERGCQVGEEVGYAVRFEDRSSAATKVKYMTDGTLLRECLEDHMLMKYSVLVLDEAHERSLNTDILFAVLKELTNRRKDLKLVITSATLEGEKFSQYFRDCPVYNVPGRCFPVDIIHSKEDHTKSYVPATIDTVLQIHTQQPPGDVLVFLTGQSEIENVVKRLNEAVSNMSEDECDPLLVLPLYASLAPELQVRVFQHGPPGVRRCIVATNVAETSITVEGVVYVVDSGVVKQKQYNPSTGMDSLDVVPISRVQATQRAGRAGRTRPGKCFRLYTKPFFDKEMPTVTLPEIQRTALNTAVLYLKSLNMDIDVLSFDFLDRPETEALEDALRQLYVLDAIDDKGDVTPLGKQMSLLPLDPTIARSLIAAKDLGVLDEMVTVAAMLSAEHIFSGGPPPGKQQLGEREGGDAEESAKTQRSQQEMKKLLSEGLGDHVLLLRLWQLWQRNHFHRDFCKSYGLDLRGMNFARDIRRQLEGIVGAHGSGLELLLPPAPGSPPPSKKRKQADEPASPGQTALRQHRRPKRPKTDAAVLDALRQALTTGFATRIAHRMRAHNGYRTMNSAGQLAQLHPTSAHLAVDEDGLLPEWIIYHEFVSTSRPFLRQVCVSRADWVEPLLPKLREVNVKRLSRSSTHCKSDESDAKPIQVESATDGDPNGSDSLAQAGRRNNDAAVSAARARFMQRKQKGK